jgi:AcrR family transcriptional regulator
VRNRRGEGARLRQDILDAARALTDEHGEQAVTLRLVARNVGIAAPSIYAHFADRDAILDVLVDETFKELAIAVSGATRAHEDPVRSLRAACGAYVDFAVRRPHRYQLAFAEREANAVPRASATATFALLVEAIDSCVLSGASASTDAFADATAIWAALHGYVNLHASRPAFAWPAQETLLNRIVDGLGRLT